MKTRVLIARIITILIALVGLLYFYGIITKPPGDRPAEVKNLRLLWTFYGTGVSADELLNKPHGVAVGRDGSIYISDTGHQRVLVIDASRRLKAKLDPGLSQKSKAKKFSRGYLGLAVADNGDVYIADKLQSKIFIVGPNGRKRGEIKVMYPLALTVSNGKLYVTTYGHVVVYDLKGRQLRKFGTRGSKPGQFDFPGGIAVDKKGNIYVSDSNNNRLVALDREGNVRWTIGKKAASMNDANRTFGLPEGLAIDDNGLLYLVDAFAGEIFVFDGNGKKLAEIGEWGDKEGQFYYPAGISYAGGRTFIVADKFNDRLEAVELNVPGVPNATFSEPPTESPLFKMALMALIAIAITSLAIVARRALKQVPVNK